MISVIAFDAGTPGGILDNVLGLVAWAVAFIAALLAGATPLIRGKLGQINKAAIAGFVIFGLFLVAGAISLVLRYQGIGVVLDEKALFIHQVSFGTTLFFALLMGMVLKYFHELSKAGRTFAEAKFIELWAPLTVSVLIFFTVWGAVAGKPIDFLSVGLAIQNGFFWQDVLGRLRP